jgi:bifunctional lysine-specific demethylase and histidyl-hydroxylase NO66
MSIVGEPILEEGAAEIFQHGRFEPKSAEEIGFADLVAPVPLETFFAEYWEKKPLVSRGRPADYFKPLFSIRDVDKAIYYLRPKPSRIEVVTGQGFVRDNYLSPDGTANLNLVLERYREGSTVILSGLEESWDSLAAFSRKLEGVIHHPVALGIYLTPPSSQGVQPHFDTQENLLLQVEGSKHWKVYGPLRELPEVEGSYRHVPRERLSEPLCETVLQAGDVLYIPRGFVHEGASGGNPSLHITVNIHVRTWFDFLSDALNSLADRDPRLRRSIPTGFLGDEQALAAVGDGFTEMMDLLHREARLDDALGKHTENLLSKPPVPDGHFSLLFTDIGPESRLKKRATVLTRFFQYNGVAGIQFSGNQIVGPSKIAEALRYVAETDPLTPASLPGPLNDNERLVLARRLVRVGLLTLA